MWVVSVEAVDQRLCQWSEIAAVRLFAAAQLSGLAVLGGSVVSPSLSLLSLAMSEMHRQGRMLYHVAYCPTP